MCIPRVHKLSQNVNTHVKYQYHYLYLSESTGLCLILKPRQSTSGLMGEADNVSLHQLSVQQVYVCTAGCGLSVICRFVAVSVFHRLTLFHTRCDGNEGHETTESQVDPQQDFVEVAGNGVGVVLVHEGEGHSGDGVEEQGGAHYRQVPALVFCCSSQPERTDDRQSLTEFIFKCHGVPLHE